MIHYLYRLLTLLAVTACTSYDQIPTGELGGRLVVEWYQPDLFVYRPHPNDPLVFDSPTQGRLQPTTFATDGGTIPPPLRVFKHYSPWGYGPAFVVHDWIYAQHHCGELRDIDFGESADVLSQIIKTMMESGRYGPADPSVAVTMDVAVRSGIARHYWDNGTCEEVPSARGFLGSPDAVFEVAY